MKKILCVDLYNILYRGFYALSEMRNAKGIGIGGFFTFVKTLKKVIKDYKIDIVIVVSDSYSIKKEKIETYKKNRDITPLEFQSQKELVLEYLSLLGISCLVLPGFEADDILVSLVKYIEKNIDEYKIYIFSGDKDLHVLLLSQNTYIINPGKFELYDQNWLKKKYGDNISEELFYLYFALVGDLSDNISGIPGVGPKNAEKIIVIYHQYNVLLNDIVHNKLSLLLSKKNIELLKKYRKNLEESYFLVFPLECDLQTNFDIDNILDKIFIMDNFEKGDSFLLQIGCPSLVSKKASLNNQIIEDGNNLIHVKNTFEVKIIYEENDLILLEDVLKNYCEIAIDTETSSGNPQETTVIGFSLCVIPDVSFYIPLYYKKQKSSIYDKVISLLKEYNVISKKWIMHNALFDLHALNRIGIQLEGFVFDTMLTAYILKENKIGLKELSVTLLQQKMNSFSEIMQFGNYSSFDEVPLEKSSVYAAADAKQTLLLYRYYSTLLSKEQYSYEKQSLYTIEFPLIKVLHYMERNGIHCDRNILLQEEKKYKEKINTIKNEIKAIVEPYNISFNPMSLKQTQHFLYNVLNLPHTKSMKTDSVSLSLLINLHPIVSLIIFYRSLLSNISHFTSGLLKYIKKDGKIYTHYQQLVTSTGRITTMNPNLQNIPRSNDVYKIRNAFHAKDNFYLVSFDYSQIELRILTHFCKDSALLDIFNQNKDMHSLTAKVLFNKEQVEDVTAVERQIAKKVNFSVLYGQGAYSLAKELQIDIKKAKIYLENFQKFYVGIFTWKDQVVLKAAVDGYVQTLFGFKRFIPELLDKNKNIFESGKRIACNTIIQGTAAEITKKAMILIYEYAILHPEIEVKLHIHDELLVEIPIKNCDLYISQIQSIMENIVSLDIPLLVNINKDYCWK